MALDTITQARLEITKIYIAAFNRAPDAAGLSNWMNQYTSGKMTYKQISEDFSNQAEYTAKYPSAMTNSEYITKIYSNVFGRTPDAGGLENWVSQLDNSATTGYTRGNIMKAMLDAAGATGNTDGLRLTNQATFAVQAVVVDGVSDVIATAQLANITSDAATVTTATAAVASSVNAGSTYTLTTGVNIMTGTSANDTFIADNTGTAEVTSTADSLNGGDGTDTIKIYSDGSIAALPALTSVEKAEIYDEDIDLNISATSWASVTEVLMTRGDGEMDLTVGSNVTTVNLADMVLTGDSTGANSAAVEGFKIAFNAAATSATVGLNKITSAAANTDEDVEITGAALTTVNVNATGTASSFDALDVAGASTINIDAAVNLTVTSVDTTSTAATLNISGAGASNLGTLDSGFTTVSSTATGATTAAINNDDTVATFGSGNDVITASITDSIASTAKLAVNAGSGTDTLILGDANDVNTAADAARYTNFEVLQTATDQDMALISSITALNVAATAGAVAFTNMSATQAANVKFVGAANAAGTSFALTSSTGTSDVLTITAGDSSTATNTALDIDSLTFNGFETLNLVEAHGSSATAGTQRTATVADFTSDKVTAINLTGSAFILEDIATTLATTFDATALTGDGATTTLGLTASGSAKVGSTIKGSEYVDTYTIGAEGSNYLGNGGNDVFKTTVAILATDGTNDGTIVGGAGTDTLQVTTTGGTTMTDNHFVSTSQLEKLTLDETGATSLTSGTAFNTAFANGVTITQASHATTNTSVVYALGLSTVDTTVALTSTTNGDATSEDLSVTTGSGADNVTITASNFVGATSADAAQVIVNTGAGADTISVTVGTIVSDTTSQTGQIDAGTGADTITKVGTNANDAQGVFEFKIEDGDSTATAYDTITGFDLGSATTFADSLDFDTATVAANATTNGTDSGTIKSHSITSGIITFDDVDSFATALTINSSNLSDVLAYVAANISTAGETVAFAFDKNGDGTNDGTFVFNQGTQDSVVELIGVVATSMSATNAATAGLIDIM